MCKIFKISFIALLFICCFYKPSGAAKPELQQSNLNGLAGSAYWKTCQPHGVSTDHPCIGASASGTTCVAPYKTKNKSYDDEGGYLLMIARNTNQGGAFFKPTFVVGRNSDKGKKPWTAYYDAGGEGVWLCKKDYTGKECSQSSKDTITSCDTTLLKQSNYSGISAVASESSSNIEDAIPNWGANYYTECSLDKNKHGKGISPENDLVLIISEWLPSGRGAYVRPYMIRTATDGYYNLESWIELYPASSIQFDATSNTKTTLLCKDGFEPNTNNTDCLPINNDVCNIKLWCEGWNESRFKSDAHVEKKVGTCLQWRCKEAGQGVVSPGAENCEPCGDTAQDGINPNNGTCVHCPDGKIFSSTASGNCADTYYVDKNKLMYGVGSQSSAITDQCWTMPDMDAYKDCVLRGLKSGS